MCIPWRSRPTWAECSTTCKRATFMFRIQSEFLSLKSSRAVFQWFTVSCPLYPLPSHYSNVLEFLCYRFYRLLWGTAKFLTPCLSYEQRYKETNDLGLNKRSVAGQVTGSGLFCEQNLSPRACSALSLPGHAVHQRPVCSAGTWNSFPSPPMPAQTSCLRRVPITLTQRWYQNAVQPCFLEPKSLQFWSTLLTEPTHGTR